MTTFFENRDVVAPGDLLAEGNYVAGENVYKDENKFFSTRVGLVYTENRRLYVVALHGFYIPHVGDLVIGKVIEVSYSSWILDINAPYLATLRASDTLNRQFQPKKTDLPSVFDVGDLILTEIIAYDRTRDPLLTIREQGLGKITRGQVTEITPAKIPRLIGRKGSMVNMLKKETGCEIEVAQNGLVLVTGKTIEDEQLAIMAIHKIEQEAHTSGLTERVTEMIQKERGMTHV